MEGNAFVQCRPIQAASKPQQDTTQPQNPCYPSPCGPNSQCREINNQPVCSCVAGFLGSPPTCHPECAVNSDCRMDQACSNQRCIDPCPGACGVNAECRVVNHNPACYCIRRYTGNALVHCHPIGKITSFESSQLTRVHFIDRRPISESLPTEVEAPPPVEQDDHVNPCLSSPCGPNAECRINGEGYTCKCLPDFIGSPPQCRPECVTNSECANDLACINRHCQDPCVPNICGLNAECHVVSHSAICECRPEFYGDPFVQCSRRENIIQLQETYNPCDPSPCGPNAMCREQNYVGVCQCIDQYQGNPYDGCRPECVLNSDCPTNKACVRNRCEDPCAGACGSNAICQVVNHLPSCTCSYGYTGDSYRYCSIIQHERESNKRGFISSFPFHLKI